MTKPRKKHHPVATTAPAPAAYARFFGEIKERIAAARTRAHLAVSRELILLYWQIGAGIVLKQKKEGWGKAVIERLAADIQREFPGIEGFSPLNLWRMRGFYLAYAEGDKNLSQAVTESCSAVPHPSQPLILSQPATELPPPEMLALPWGHHVLLTNSIGLILCQEKKRLVAEYALRGMDKAIGVSEYQLTRSLPKQLKGSLPTIEEIEAELHPS